MAKIAAPSVALLSKLHISATEHVSVSALTETTIKTFIAAASTQEVLNPTDLTGIGAGSNYVTVAQLGKTVATQLRAQPTPPTLTFSMLANPSDAGQTLVLDAGTDLRGFVIEIVAADGGIRYKGFNGFCDTIENVSADGAYTIDVSIAVENFIKTEDDTSA